MRNKPVFPLISGILLFTIAVLGAVQLHARQQFLYRGWVMDFPEPVNDTGASRACVNAALEQYDDAHLTWALDTIADGGFVWVRQRFAWAEIEPSPGAFRWELWDAIVAEAGARGLRLIAVLDTAPGWAGLPPDSRAFAQFAEAFATRYGDALTYYQIWHNPNLGDSWSGYANAYEYTELLAGASEAIRAADPDARIVLGSLAPNVEVGERNYAEDVFLDMLYVAGAGPYFDVVAVQPYGFFAGPEDREVDRDVLNFSRAILTREALERHGEGDKAVWISHFGWNSKSEDWPGPVSIWGHVDAAAQADYTVAALERAEREWSWMGVMCLNGFQPRPEEGPPVSQGARTVPDAEEHWGFALVGPDGEARPVHDAVRAWAARARGATPGAYNANTSLATFAGTWVLGPQGADIGQTGDRVALPFEGTGVALTVRRGPYRAFLFVTVDGDPAPALPRDRDGRSYVVLYDPLAAVATVPLAEDLPYGPHTVEVVAERGWNQWALVDWRVANQPDVRLYRWGLAGFALLGVVGLGMALLSARRLDWGTLRAVVSGGWARLREWGQMAISFGLSAIYLFSAWQMMMGEDVFRRLGWGSDATALALATVLFYFSPWFLMALVAGGLVALIVFANPVLGLMLTVFAAPLYMHPLSLLGKSFALAELVLLPTLIGWGVKRIARYKSRDTHQDSRFTFHVSRLTSHPFFTPILTLVLVAIASTLFAQHRREALRELRLVVIEPVLFYVALVTLPMSKRERWRMVDVFVASALLVALVGLMQYGVSFCRGMPFCDKVAAALGDVITAEGGTRRLHSVYGSPNNVGLYLGRVAPVLIVVALWGGGAPASGQKSEVAARWWDRLKFFADSLFHSPRRLFYAVALLPVGAALLLSLSRGAIVLGIPAALLVLGFLAGPAWRRATVIVLVLGMLALIPLLRTPRFAGMFDFTGGTTGFRFSLWHSAWGMVRDAPVLGVGPDNFLYAYRTRYVLPTAWEEFNLSHPHNVVMDFASRLGILGLGVFVWLQAIFWRRSLPMRHDQDTMSRALALGVMGSMADFLGHGLVDASYFVIDLAFAFFFSLAIVTWLSERKE